MKIKMTILGMMLAMLLSGCDKDKPQPATQAGQTPEPPAVKEATPTKVPEWNFTGKVVETMDASGYTYCRVDNGKEQKWVAILKTPVAVGEEVSFKEGLVMHNFESRTLGRVFDEIVFSSGIEGREPVAPPPAAAMLPGGDEPAGGADSFSAALKEEGQDGPAMGGAPASMGSGQAVVPFEDLKVEKAAGENSHTIGEVFDKAVELNGKPVQVRGKVMKVSRNIMGTNWIHLQDGTGDPMRNTHDLVVTSQEIPEMGAVVTVSGTLQANKDFGSGYRYEAIMEGVTIAE